MPAAVRDVADPPARAFARGARSLTGDSFSGGARAADPPERSDQPDVPDGVGQLRPPRGLEVRQQVELAGVVGAVTRHGTAAPRTAGRRSRPATAGSGAPGRRGFPRRRRCTAARRRRRAERRSPPVMAFAGAARSGAGAFGRAAGRAGEAGCASSHVPSSQVVVDAEATASPSGRRGLIAARSAGCPSASSPARTDRGRSSPGSASSRGATC